VKYGLAVWSAIKAQMTLSFFNTSYPFQGNLISIGSEQANLLSPKAVIELLLFSLFTT